MGRSQRLKTVTQKRGYEDYNPNFFKCYNDWDNPQEIEWVGYGYDSIKQGLDDIRHIEGKDQNLEARREMIAKLEQTRALPNQALIGTAINEAVRLSIANQNGYVTFDDAMRPVVM